MPYYSDDQTKLEIDLEVFRAGTLVESHEPWREPATYMIESVRLHEHGRVWHALPSLSGIRHIQTDLDLGLVLVQTDKEPRWNLPTLEYGMPFAIGDHAYLVQDYRAILVGHDHPATNINAQILRAYWKDDEVEAQ